MPFEYDLAKSNANKIKHGIGFKEAERMWRGRILELNARYHGESRKLCIGKIENIYWTAIITYRGSKIRIISIRRARENEKEIKLSE